MASYDDNKDLIQNQRALAEIVQNIDNVFHEMLDENYDTTFNARLKDLSDQLTAAINSCTQDTDTHVAQTRTVLTNLEERVNALNESISKFIDPINPGSPNIESLTGNIGHCMAEIDGYTDTKTGEWVEGIKAIVTRLDTKVPSIVLLPADYIDWEDDRKAVEIATRVSDVLYGTITDQVRPIEEGTEVRISPYMQGVIREVGEGE